MKQTDEQPEISIAPEPADSDDVRWCFEQYYEELNRRFEDGFVVADALPLDLESLTPPRGVVLIARQDGQPVGCTAVILEDADIAGLKRMWVSASARGQGIGGRLLAAIEARAIAAGKSRVRLETSSSLTEANAMYRRRGYEQVEAFNEERYADNWFEKDLSAAIDA
jgi:GNAT superfamily N-acetyltransferase